LELFSEEAQQLQTAPYTVFSHPKFSHWTKALDANMSRFAVFQHQRLQVSMKHFFTPDHCF